MALKKWHLEDCKKVEMVSRRRPCLISSPEKGQVLIEFVAASVLVALTFGIIAKVFWREWIRFQCRYEVFQATHAKVIGADPFRSQFRLRFDDNGKRVRGTAECGAFS